MTWPALALFVILLMGVFLRVYPSTGFRRMGMDEHAYTVFLKQIDKAGVLNYDKVVSVYMERQYAESDALVPATRLGFLLPAYALGKVFRLDEAHALRSLNCVASILTLLVAALFSYRAGGPKLMLGTSLLLATAPLQIHLAQRALIDGYFAFWATAVLWLGWENLQRPRAWRWLTAYGLCLFALVLTKENAAFVVATLLGALLIFHWLKLGRVSSYLLGVTVLAPAAAVFLLTQLCGGIREWIRFYLMFVGKSRTTSYAVHVQDGAWFRYLVDFTLLSPLVALAAIGCIFALRREKRLEVFASIFLLLSFFAMTSVTYGMSLRFAAYWDVPLCLLASSQILNMSQRWPTRAGLIATVALSVIGLSSLQQYHRYFVAKKIYDPISIELIRGADMYKVDPPKAD